MPNCPSTFAERLELARNCANWTRLPEVQEKVAVYGLHIAKSAQASCNSQWGNLDVRLTFALIPRELPDPYDLMCLELRSADNPEQPPVQDCFQSYHQKEYELLGGLYRKVTGSLRAIR